MPWHLFQKPAVVLFGTFDVRVGDHPALEQASFHSAVIPVFLWSREEQGRWGVQGALEVVLKAALRSLDARLRQGGLRLLCRNVGTAGTAAELVTLCEEANAAVVYWNKEHTTESRLLDKVRKRALETKG